MKKAGKTAVALITALALYVMGTLSNVLAAQVSAYGNARIDYGPEGYKVTMKTIVEFFYDGSYVKIEDLAGDAFIEPENGFKVGVGYKSGVGEVSSSEITYHVGYEVTNSNGEFIRMHECGGTVHPDGSCTNIY